MKCTWLLCLSLLLGSTAAWANPPEPPLSVTQPEARKQIRAQTQTDATMPRVYRSKKLRIHKHGYKHQRKSGKRERLEQPSQQPKP